MEDDIPRMEDDMAKEETVKQAPYLSSGMWAGILTAICAFILYKLIVKVVTAEEKKSNRFNAKKKKPKYVQLDKMPNHLYRLARASEPSRDAYGEPTREIGVEATVGYEAEREAGRVTTKGYWGDPKGLDAKFIHLSMEEQVKDTAKMYFAGVDELILLKFSTAALTKNETLQIKFEEAEPAPGVQARGGVFPHVYASERGQRARLPYWTLKGCFKLPLGADGLHSFPAEAFSEAEEDGAANATKQ